MRWFAERNSFQRWRKMTQFASLMWVVWAVLVLSFAGVSLYSSHLAKNEEDQLFLDDSFNHVKAEQEAIVARVQKIEPLKRVALALAAAMTLFVIGYYILNIINQFR
jgi:hypothetical protein